MNNPLPVQDDSPLPCGDLPDFSSMPVPPRPPAQSVSWGTILRSLLAVMAALIATAFVAVVCLVVFGRTMFSDLMATRPGLVVNEATIESIAEDEHLSFMFEKLFGDATLPDDAVHIGLAANNLVLHDSNHNYYWFYFEAPKESLVEYAERVGLGEYERVAGTGSPEPQLRDWWYGKRGVALIPRLHRRVPTDRMTEFEYKQGDARVTGYIDWQNLCVFGWLDGKPAPVTGFPKS